MNKKVLFGMAVLFAVTFAAVFFSLYQSRSVEKDLAKQEDPGLALPVPTAGDSTAKRARRPPRRPEDDGLLVIHEGNRPKDQEGWDSVLAEAVRTMKTQMPSEALAALETEEEQAHLKEKISKIEEELQKCGAALKQNPGDREVRDRMDNLMMLKSIGKSVTR